MKILGQIWDGVGMNLGRSGGFSGTIWIWKKRLLNELRLIFVYFFIDFVKISHTAADLL